MDEAVRNLESAESTLLRDRIVICMTTDLPADDTDPFAEVMAAGCPAYGTDTVVINRVITAQPAGLALRILPFMYAC